MNEGQGWPSLGTAKGSNSNTDSSIILSGVCGGGVGVGVCGGVVLLLMSQLDSPRVRACRSSRFSSVVLPHQRERVWKLLGRMKSAGVIC